MSEPVEELNITAEDVLSEYQNVNIKLMNENIHLSAMLKKRDEVIKDLRRQLSDLSD
ncbi:hypothetical protein EalM132_00094 [Exiguobacterium phage vB_EalM-132]|nr:hypothetical protein EalM132_00094 [Exiguobacterium phage vB_EalM-132]